jgi:membrane-bound serine protease (ClpP class)
MGTKYKWIWILAVLLVLGSLMSSTAFAVEENVVVIPIKGEIETGLVSVVRRGIQLAESQSAALIILEIGTPGGRVDAALAIKDLVTATNVPVIAFITDRAWSAGALIALSADEIAMAPGSSIGAAETEPNTPKILSAWRSEMEAVAERNGRDSRIAAAMVDKDLVIDGLVGAGDILTLTANRAAEVGYAEYSVTSRTALLAEKGLIEARVSEIQPTWIERLARTITSPSIAPLLLLVGFVGLTMELLIPGFGIAGIIGVSCLGLFFGGHMLAGLAGWEALLAFTVGVILLFVEAFVTPGFGVAGVSGLLLLFAGIYFTSGDLVTAARTIMISFFGAILVTALLFRFTRKSPAWNRIILGHKLNRESGYISTNELMDLEGKTGISLTMLRPAGIAEIEGNRVDVVSEGGFVPVGQMIKVVKVEGSRIIVQTVDNS